MNNLEYTSGNTVTRYPFKDNAPLTWTSYPDGETGELPNNVIKDVRITSQHNDLVTVNLENITYSFADLDSPGPGDAILVSYTVDPKLGINVSPYAFVLEFGYG